MCWQTGQTPMLHFLCDAIIRVMFDDNPEPQVLNLEVIGEIGGSMITAVAQVCASQGKGTACRQSIIKSILWNNIGKNHVGYYYIAKVINIALMLENDIILQIYPLLGSNLAIGQFNDYDLITQVGK
ncbi:MAG: hypothetical protein EZS28_048942 [Streblomastix strix]|uniref:Uncharacterized protein n=1 Tax=Streblomastix strix TaxID=222440 RepID=A0A5J4TCZ0_9EUKA|nr:MAG: hypothetical protein EZS28_048942 [Streblomastix strix]